MKLNKKRKIFICVGIILLIVSLVYRFYGIPPYRYQLMGYPLKKGFNLVLNNAPISDSLPFLLNDNRILFISEDKPFQEKVYVFNPKEGSLTQEKKLDFSSIKFTESNHVVINGYEMQGEPHIGYLYKKAVPQLQNAQWTGYLPGRKLLVESRDDLFLYSIETKKFTPASIPISPENLNFLYVLKNGKLFLVDSSTKKIYLYNPETNKIEKSRIFPELIPSPGITELPDGNLLLTGGELKISPGLVQTASDSVFFLNPNTLELVFKAKMLEKRLGHNATLLNNHQVLITGGIHSSEQGGETTLASMGNVYLDSAEIFDLKKRKSISIEHMDTPRRSGYTTPYTPGKIFISGGEYAPIYSDFPDLNPTVEIYVEK